VIIKVRRQMSWYGLYTRCCHEQRIYDQLLAKSFHAFFPTVEVWSRRRDRRKKIQRPLFPGYVFVNSPMDRYHQIEILSIRGIVRILNNGEGEPVPIPDEQIESVKQLLESRVPFRYHPYLKEGDRVRIISGPMAGVEGIVVRSLKEARLVIAVDHVNQALSVHIDEELTERL